MKIIIITGCSSGMGAEAARYLVANTESTVIGIARSTEKLNLLSEQLNTGEAKGRFLSIPFNLSDISNYDQLKLIIEKHVNEIHVLINNAGTLVKKPFPQISSEEFEAVMETNFKAPFFLIQQLLPLFAKRAHIVNITSMGGFQGSVKFPGLSVYSASKAALSNLTECLATELSEKEISVNAIAPGAVQTDMLARAFPDYKAPVSPEKAGEFIGHFAMNGNYFFNGKILPLSVSTP
jgi:3-oxoacyl-[acyl-carrier protein] reductase